MKKYEICKEITRGWYGTDLYRIRACKSFETINERKVEVGDLGGWIEKEDNLSQAGLSWIADDGKVLEDAKVCENAWVGDDAEISGCAEISGEAVVFDRAIVCESSKVFEDACVHNNAMVRGRAIVCGSATVCDNAEVWGCTIVCEKDIVRGDGDILVEGGACDDTKNNIKNCI